MGTTTEQIVIKVSEDGSRTVKRNLEELGKAGDNASKSAVNLSNVLKTIAVGAIATQVLSMVNRYDDLQNKLKLVTSSAGNLIAVEKELFAAAGRTRSGYEATIDLFAKVSRSTEQFGLSQKQTIGIVENISKAVTLSGASAASAQAALMQFGQGLSAGALRGEEFNSVAEQTPEVIRVLAESMNVPIGQMRKLAADGKITADVIIKAFSDGSEASKKLAEQFAKTGPTLAQAFGRAHDVLTRFVGGMNTTTGISSSLARAIYALADNFQQVSAVIMSVIAGFAVLAGPTAIMAVYARLNALFLLLNANPFVALATGLAVAITYFSQTEDAADGLLQQLNRSIGPIDRFQAFFAGAVEYVKSAWENFPFWLEYIVKTAVNKAITLLVSFADSLNTIANGVMKFFGDMFNFTVKENQKIDLGPLMVTMSEGAKNAGEAAGLAYKQGFVQKALDLSKENDPNAKLNGPGKNTFKPPVDEAAMKKAAQEIERLKEAYRQLLGQLNPVIAAENQLADGTKILDDMLKRKLITQETYNKNLADLKASLEDALHPMQAIMRQLEQEEKLLGMSSQARRIEQTTIGLINDAKQKGVELTTKEIEQIRERLKLTALEREKSEIRDQLRDNSSAVVMRRVGLQSSMIGEGKGLTAGDKSIASAGLLSQMGVDVSGTTLEVDAQLAQMQRMYDTIDIMRKDNVLSEEQAAQLRMKIDNERNALKLRSETMALETLASLSTSGNKKLAAIGKAAAIADAAIKGQQAIMNAYANGGPYPMNLVNAGAMTLVQAAVLAKMAGMKGFSAGGYTGDAGRSQIAGVVHGQEFVMNAEATAANRPMLEAMNAGKAAAGSGVGTLNIKITNQIPNAQYDVKQIDESTVEVIARRVVESETDRVTAGNIKDPGSRTSRSLSQNLKTTRNY